MPDPARRLSLVMPAKAGIHCISGSRPTAGWLLWGIWAVRRAAHVDWQVVSTLDYTLKPWVALRLGYRSLNVTASGSDFGHNVHMKGPILGATFRF